MKFKEALVAHLNGETVMCNYGAYEHRFIDVFGSVRVAQVDTHGGCWDFHIKPKTVMCNGVEVPAPETFALHVDDTYFVPSVTSEVHAYQAAWVGSARDRLLLGLGLVYLREEDAKARAKAMLLTT